MKTKAAVVIPTIREAAIARFINEWDKVFFYDDRFDTTLFVIEDNPTKTFAINKTSRIIHFSWNEIDLDLKDKSWIIPRRTDGIRSYGYYRAWLSKPDLIITLDDDCYPIKGVDFLGEHWRRLSEGQLATEERWISTTKPIIRPRGLPYKNTDASSVLGDIILNHGMWDNVPDFDATTQLKRKKTSGLSNYSINQLIPHRRFFPMCGMNLSWRPHATSALYFLLMGENALGQEWGYHRFGDIWAGLIFKKISDHLEFNISSGDPLIWHDRASNALVNLDREKKGIVLNENLWKIIDKASLKGKDYKSCYLEMAKYLEKSLNNESFWQKTSSAMKVWAHLFSKQ